MNNLTDRMLRIRYWLIQHDKLTIEQILWFVDNIKPTMGEALFILNYRLRVLLRGLLDSSGIYKAMDWIEKRTRK
jgi:hypothetical protein